LKLASRKINSKPIHNNENDCDLLKITMTP